MVLMPLGEVDTWRLDEPDEAQIPPARDSATVVLIREGIAGPELYLMRRQATMVFPGAYVFPGGLVDAADSEIDIAWVGESPEVWASRLGCDEATARGLVCAAVRETFEEAGILLAGPDAHSIVADVSGPDFIAARVALENRELSFAAFLRDFNLVLRADLLAAWSHWVTPIIEPKRFDTRFFVARLPEGQAVGELPGEADRAAWTPLEEAIEASESRSIVMLPPTYQTCVSLRGIEPHEVLTAAAQRSIVPVLPKIVEVDGAYFLRMDLPEENDD
ncbi:MAG: hydrolase [Nocardioidaceae bacterium]|nr:hydrolase [Nocardioidaceae bacterium]